MSGDDTSPTPSRPSRPSLHSGASGPVGSNASTRGAGPAGLSVLASIGPGLQTSGRRTARLWWGSALLLGLAGGVGLWVASSPRAVETAVEARTVAPVAVAVPTPTALPAPAPAVTVAAAAPLSAVPSASAPGASPAVAAAAAARIENVNGPASAVAVAASAPLAAVAKAAQTAQTAPAVRTASAHKAPHKTPHQTAHQTPHQSAQRTASHTAPKPRPADTPRAAAAGPDRGETTSAVSTAAFGPKRDTDVDLLEAMVAHDARPPRAAPPPKAAGTASPALARQIERCNAPGVADPVACLAKACAGRGPEDARCAAPARAP